jgi:3-oxoacyl-[acyl-carrier-protein] synthase III
MLQQAQTLKEDIDLLVFHQTNASILEELRRLLELPKEFLPQRAPLTSILHAQDLSMGLVWPKA